MGGMALNRVAGRLNLLANLRCQNNSSSRSTASSNAIDPRQARQVMLFSGLAGLFLGLTCEWQIAVESAQAIAGVVAYPADNPFYMYHLKSWTLLHQLPAALLAGGMNERWLSMSLAGLTGALSFQAIALCTFVFCRNRFLACVMPLACDVTNACRDFECIHQIRLLPEAHWAIYGTLGVAYVLFSWSLLAAGFRRTCAILLGLGPAIHPTLGAWGLMIAAPIFAWSWRREPDRLGRELAAFSAGAVITGISLGVQLYLARNISSPDPELARQLVTAFAQGWDNHRIAVSLLHPILTAVGCAIAIGLVWLYYGVDASSPEAVLLRCLCTSALVGLTLALSTHAQSWLPFSYVMAMPGRFIDIIAVAFPAITVGIVARYQSRLLLHAVLTLTLAYLLLKAIMMTTHRIYVPKATHVLPAVGLALLLAAEQLTGSAKTLRGSRTFWLLVRIFATAGMGAAALACRLDRSTVIAIAVVGFALVLLSSSRIWWKIAEAYLARWQPLEHALQLIDVICLTAIAAIVAGLWLSAGLTAGGLFLTRNEWLPFLRRFGLQSRSFSWSATALLAAASAVLTGGAFYYQIRTGHSQLRRWQNDPVFTALSRHQGLVLTSGRIPLVQLQSRRGVLLYGAAMNQITYVPASAPKINEILQQIYGEDLLRPRPSHWVACGGLLPESARELWANRSPEEWQELSRRFGFTDVVTYATWSLKLPLVATGKRYAVFHVPREEPSPAGTDEQRHSLARLPSKSDSISADTSLPNVGE
jgi:hypothetical protein